MTGCQQIFRQRLTRDTCDDSAANLDFCNLSSTSCCIMIGIYKITNLKNNKVYIGLSIDIERRWRNHLRSLDKGTHTNFFLQRDYSLLEDKDLLEFEVIEECSSEELADREIYWIEFYDSYRNPEKGYNLTPGGDRGSEPKFSKKFVVEVRRRLKSGEFAADVVKDMGITRTTLRKMALGISYSNFNKFESPLEEIPKKSFKPSDPKLRAEKLKRFEAMDLEIKRSKTPRYKPQEKTTWRMKL